MISYTLLNQFLCNIYTIFLHIILFHKYNHNYRVTILWIKNFPFLHQLLMDHFSISYNLNNIHHHQYHRRLCHLKLNDIHICYLWTGLILMFKSTNLLIWKFLMNFQSMLTFLLKFFHLTTLILIDQQDLFHFFRAEQYLPLQYSPNWLSQT